MITTPTTQEIADNIVAHVESKISQTLPFLPKGFTRVLSKPLAGVLVLLYKYIGFLLLQMFVRTASMKETVVNGRTIRPLVEWGRQIGVGDPNDATRAEHTISVTVTNQTGSLPAGSQLLYAPTQVVYNTLSAVLLNASTVSVTIRAATPGAIGNLADDTVLQFANPLPNIARDASITGQTVTGADAEDPEVYRARVLKRSQRKPQGGAYADYQQWAEDVAGVVNAYPYTGLPGRVTVYVEVAVVPGNPDGIPTTPQINAVKAAIELDQAGLASNRPANALVSVLPITRSAYDLVVVGLSDSAAQPAIETAVDEYLRSRAPFIEGISVLPRVDRVSSGAVAGLVEDVVNSVGATVISARLEQAAVAVVANTLGDGEKAKLGASSYL